jgi:hypothetical protein
MFIKRKLESIIIRNLLLIAIVIAKNLKLSPHMLANLMYNNKEDNTEYISNLFLEIDKIIKK